MSDFVFGMGMLAAMFLVGASFGCCVGDMGAERRRNKRLARRLYVCQCNGVIGVVRALDYEIAAEEFWARHFRDNVLRFMPKTPPRFNVDPVVTFSKTGGGFTTKMYLLDQLVEGCEIEERKFDVPNHFHDVACFKYFFELVHGRKWVPKMISN